MSARHARLARDMGLSAGGNGAGMRRSIRCMTTSGTARRGSWVTLIIFAERIAASKASAAASPAVAVRA